MKNNKLGASLVLAAALLQGCGEKETFVGQQLVGDTNAAGESIALTASSPQVGTSSGDAVVLTAMVTDQNNNLLVDRAVQFSADSGMLLVDNGGVTGDTGTATATLSPGTDPSNRTITVTASSAGAANSYAVATSGTRLSVSGDTSVVSGASGKLLVTLRDSNDQTIVGKEVIVSSANANTLEYGGVTAADGMEVTVTGVMAGEDTITFSSLGATASHSLTVSPDRFTLTAPATDIAVNACQPIEISWVRSDGTADVPQSGTVSVSASRGSIFSDSTCATAAPTVTTGATGSVTAYIRSAQSGPSTIDAKVTGGPATSAKVEFVATTVDSVVLQTDTPTVNPGGSATLTAVVRDPVGNLVKGKGVLFGFVDDLTTSDLSATNGTTDSYGRATTTFKASDVSSPGDGVVVQATVQGFSSTVDLTIGQKAVGISIGMGTRIASLDTATYQYLGSLVVVDSAGNAKPNATVTLQLLATHYDQGGYGTYVDPISGDTKSGYISANTANVVSFPLSCASEDLDRDGFLDAGEDANGNGILDGHVVATINTQVTTDQYGHASFDIVYPKDYATWTQVMIRATTGVTGTESSATTEFVLPMSQDDASSPPGQTSPFGVVGGC